MNLIVRIICNLTSFFAWHLMKITKPLTEQIPYENRLRHQVNQMRPHQTSDKLEVQTQLHIFLYPHKIRLETWSCVQTSQQCWHKSDGITWLTGWCYIITINLSRPTIPKSKHHINPKSEHNIICQISNKNHIRTQTYINSNQIRT